jgi:SAM-dependent methyltransferase
MSASSVYTTEYYRHIESGSLASARHIVPLLIAIARPARVLDVGCGTGAWLSTFQRHGITDVHGIDIDAVPTDALLFPVDRFTRVSTLAPFEVGEPYDLVLCLEVAEHIEEQYASMFVRSLTSCGPVVAFSAAVPGQGGAGHVNEQWPDYWAAHFERQDFVCCDCIRWRIWNNPEIKFWFRQNTLLFVQRPFVDRLVFEAPGLDNGTGRPFAVVHPELLTRLVLSEDSHGGSRREGRSTQGPPSRHS